MKYWLLLSIITVFLTGCMSQEEAIAYKQKQEDDAKQKEIARVIDNAPSGAFDVRDMGNGWWMFSLTTDGKTRQFLWQKYDAGDTRVEILTEISPSDTTHVNSNQ